MALVNSKILRKSTGSFSISSTIYQKEFEPIELDVGKKRTIYKNSLIYYNQANGLP